MRVQPECNIFSLGSSYLNVALTTVHHLCNDEHSVENVALGLHPYTIFSISDSSYLNVPHATLHHLYNVIKGKSSPYLIAECRVLELIPVLGSQPAGEVNHQPGGRLPLLSARPAVTLATLKRAATNFAAW